MVMDRRRRKRTVSQAAVLFVLLLPLCACASYTDETKEIRSLYQARAYPKAAEKLDESGLKESSRSRLLYLLERAMILDRLGQLARSRALLIEADELADKLYTTSISNEALTLLYNDTAQDYPGEDYEKVAIHTVLTLSFLEDNNLKSAIIQARKINNKLTEINQKYDERKNRYSEDAFARYLAGAIHEARGAIDDAIIDYRKAVALYEGIYASEFANPIPDQLVQALHRLYTRRGRSEARLLEKKYSKIISKDRPSPGSAEVLVVHEVGNIAVKKAKNFFIPFGKQVIRLSWPSLNPRTGFWSQSSVSVGSKTVSAEKFQNMDLIAEKTLEDKRLRLVVKQGARLLAKGQLTEQAHRNFGPIGGIAANVYSAVSETADTRGWTLLPRGFFVTRLALKPGNHKLEIRTDGLPVKSQLIELKKGQLLILRSKP